MGFDWDAFRNLSSLLENLQLYKETCLKDSICPECGQDVIGGFGTGRLADGKFCSISCFANFRKVEGRFLKPPSRN